MIKEKNAYTFLLAAPTSAKKGPNVENSYRNSQMKQHACRVLGKSKKIITELEREPTENAYPHM